MGKRRYNPLANLHGFVNLTNKKRKTTKIPQASGNRKTHLENLASNHSSNRSLRFMDAYRRGLNGNQAAWASKKYRGHTGTIPESILNDLEKAGIH